jgi:hypothetical protein
VLLRRKKFRFSKPITVDLKNKNRVEFVGMDIVEEEAAFDSGPTSVCALFFKSAENPRLLGQEIFPPPRSILMEKAASVPYCFRRLLLLTVSPICIGQLQSIYKNDDSNDHFPAARGDWYNGWILGKAARKNHDGRTLSKWSKWSRQYL